LAIIHRAPWRNDGEEVQSPSPSILHQSFKEPPLYTAKLPSTKAAVVAATESKRVMSKIKAHLSLLGLSLLPLASAQAQEYVDKGFYAVGRAGGMVNPEVKFETEALPESANANDTVKYKFAPFGELGGGYRFGGFRVEETLGYSSSDARSAVTQGHARFYSLTISGFADIPVSEVIVPYVGGGMGAVRVDSTSSWTSAIAGADASFESRSWGPFWHLDAGVGFRVAPRVTLEVGGRYSRSLSMRRFGHGDSDNLLLTSQFNSVTATAGVRYAF
jgi:opacity protein-like surface antigen